MILNMYEYCGHVMVPLETKRGLWFPETGLSDDCGVLGCRELNLDSLQKYQVLLPSDLTVQPHNFLFVFPEIESYCMALTVLALSR